MTEGQELLQKAKTAGFSDEEIQQGINQERNEAVQAGFSGTDVDAFYGDPPFNSDSIRQHMAADLATEETHGRKKWPVKTIPEAIEHGILGSIFEMGATQRTSPYEVDNDTPFLARQFANFTGMVADLPFYMGFGALSGGSTARGVAGSFALTAGLRRIMMDKYDKGEVKSAKEFADRAVGASWDTTKGYVEGFGIVKMRALLGPKADKYLSPTVKSAAMLASDAATLTTLSAALELRIPEPMEFVDSLVVMGVFKGGERAVSKARGIFANTGVRPSDMAADSLTDVTIAQDVASVNKPEPSRYVPERSDLVRISGPYKTNEGTLIWVSGNPEKGVTFQGDIYEGSHAYLTAVISHTEGTGIGTKTVRAFEQEAGRYGAKYVELENTMINTTEGKSYWNKLGYEETGKISVNGFPMMRKTVLDPSKIEYAPEDVVNDPAKLDAWMTDPATIAKFEEPPAVKPPPVKPVPISKKTELEKAQEAILSQIVQETPRKLPTWAELRASIIDDLDPIRRYEKEGIEQTLWKETEGRGDLTGEGQKNIFQKDIQKLVKEKYMEWEKKARSSYVLERLTRGIFGKGTYFIRNGTFDAETYETIGKSYEAAIKPVKGDLNNFRAYMASRRAVELAARPPAKRTTITEDGVKVRTEEPFTSGFNIDAAKIVVKAGREKYEPVFQDVMEYRDTLVDYLVKAEILTAEQVAGFREMNRAHVPFYRYFEEDAGRPSTAKGPRNPIKRITSNENKILDPIESHIKDTYLFLALAEKNMARLQFIQNLGNTDLIERVHKPTIPIEVEAKELDKWMKSQGIEASAEDAMTIFRAGRIPDAPDQITVYVKGERQVWSMKPAVAEAFHSADKYQASLLGKILSLPAQYLRAGTITSLDYMVTNVMRDALTALVFTGAHPLKTARGFYEVVTHGPAWEKWMKGGGAGAVMVAMDRNYIQENIHALDVKTGLATRTWNLLKTPLHILQAASSLLENSTRVGAVRSELMQAKTKAAIQALCYISREATVDFSVHGNDPIIRHWSNTAAFMNPGMQGLDRLQRALHDEPLPILARAFAGITLPSVLLWWVNKDDEEIQNLPAWQRNLFWPVRVPLPNGESFIARIKKPFDLGLFGTIPERLLDAFYAENPDAFKDMDKTFMQAVGFNIIPTYIAPPTEQMANRSLFTNNPLIPPQLEGLMPEYQYNDYTTETAKKLGELIGAFPGMTDQAIRSDNPFVGGTARALTTPILIENYVRGWTGSLGTQVLHLIDWSLRKAGVVPDPILPTSTLADIPFVRAFVIRYPSTSVASVQNFYDTYSAKKVVYDTFQRKAAEGDIKAIEKIIQYDPNAWDQAEGIRQTLTEHSKMIHDIHKDQSMTSSDQRQLIDTFLYNMIEVSKFGNELLREIDKNR